MRTPFAILCLGLMVSPALAVETSQSDSFNGGPWKIATTYDGNKFDNCTMSRTLPDVDVTFVQTGDGLSLILHSKKWKLDRGKVYKVRLSAGAGSVDAKALAERKSVTITLTDAAFNKHLRFANLLDIRGAAETIPVPLNGSDAAFARLDRCFNKNSERAETNPFATREANPFVAAGRSP